MTTFESLNLIEPLLKALAAEKHITPTPIQVQAIPALLQGRDVVGCAQTGTGKTAAFALPVLQHLNQSDAKGVRALILSPTRELAAQIGASFQAYGRFLRVRHTVIYGGVSDRGQIDQLRRGVEIIIATPGRLLDLMNQGYVDLSKVEFLILDEADRMLDMGFIPDVRRIIKAMPKQRQNLLFSATMPKGIVELVNNVVKDPVRIEITPETPTVEAIEQHVMFVAKADKTKLLIHIFKEKNIGQAIIFTRTKSGADKVYRHLDKQGLMVGVIHGDKSQNIRTRTLNAFRDGRCHILIATDIASRGIDVDDITHVFNHDLPPDAESYIHRIGRTGRAGRSGTSISFCDEDAGEALRNIEKATGATMTVDKDHPFHLESAIPPAPKTSPKQGGKRPSNRRR